mgnify:CR=1 FL=1
MDLETYGLQNQIVSYLLFSLIKGKRNQMSQQSLWHRQLLSRQRLSICHPKIHRKPFARQRKKVWHSTMGTNLRFQPSCHLVLRGVLFQVLLRRIQSRKHQQQVYASNQQLHPKVPQNSQHRLKYVGHENFQWLYWSLEMENYTRQN